LKTASEKEPGGEEGPAGGASNAGRQSLPRKLGLLSAIAVLAGSAIGSGIFRSPAGIATKIPDVTFYLLNWALGGLLALCGALTYAELAGALPYTGGVFVYLREGFGRLPAFLFGWSELTIIRASALGAVATVFAEYLLRMLGVQNPAMVHYIAAAAIIVTAAFNILGINLGALVQNLTTGAKYAALLILVAASFLIGANHPAQVSAVAGVPSGLSLSRFGLALVSVMWVYDGWADLTFVSGEVKRPQRNLPLALILGTLSVVALFLLSNLAYLHLLDIHQIGASKLVAADTAYRIFGDAGVRFVSIAVMIAAFGTLNGSMMTGPRIFFAMADEGLFFKKVATVHPRFKTPYIAIALAATLAIIFVSVRTFEQLADTFVLAIWPFYAGGIAAVYVLRRKQPDLPRPYRTLGYPVTPALFLLATVFMLGNAVVDDVGYFSARLSGMHPVSQSSGALLISVIILAGIPAYYTWIEMQARFASEQTRPSKAP
jgi:APA family basic amino acid/polyamine antiporter